MRFFVERIAVFVALSIGAAPCVSADEAVPAPQTLALGQILKLHVALETELRARGILRTRNLTGELAEHLFVATFGWDLADPSQKGFDATDGALRYQIKARRVADDATHHQLGAIRDMDGFDVLAVLIFDQAYGIRAAALVPVGGVRAKAAFNGYTNSFRLVVTDDMLRGDGATDVTEHVARTLRDHR